MTVAARYVKNAADAIIPPVTIIRAHAVNNQHAAVIFAPIVMDVIIPIVPTIHALVVKRPDAKV